MILVKRQWQQLITRVYYAWHHKKTYSVLESCTSSSALSGAEMMNNENKNIRNTPQIGEWDNDNNNKNNNNNSNTSNNNNSNNNARSQTCISSRVPSWRDLNKLKQCYWKWNINIAYMLFTHLDLLRVSSRQHGRILIEWTLILCDNNDGRCFWW